MQMIHIRGRLGGKWALVQGAFIFAWITGLENTDFYYSVYVLCALFSAYALLANYKAETRLTTKESVWLALSAMAFSFAVILGNVPLFFHGESLKLRFVGVLSLIGGFFAAWNILQYLYIRVAGEMKYDAKNAASGNLRPGVVFWIVFFAVSIIDLIYLFYCAYPGVLTTDSISTVRQLMTHTYNNTMPFWHTVTFGAIFRIAMALCGDINAAVACYMCVQIFFVAACFAYAVMTLYQAGVRKSAVVFTGMLFVLMPYNIVYSVTLWKDVLFGAAALLIVTALYRIMRNIGKRNIQNYIVLFFGGMGLSLWRTNGWYAFLVTTIVVILVFRKRKHMRPVIFLFLAIVIIGWVMINPVLTALNVEETDWIEALGVPFQQIGRYVAEDCWMDDMERDFLSEIFDLEIIKQSFDPHIVDPVKFLAFKRENKAYFESNLWGYLKLYLQFFVRRPDVYVEAWSDLTKGFWGGGFPNYIYDFGVMTNDFGIVHQDYTNAVSELFGKYFAFIRWETIFQPLVAIGLNVWAIIACCVINSLKKRNELLLSIPLIVLSVGLWFGTPVVAEFSYGYPIMLAAPFIISVTFFVGRNGHQTEKGTGVEEA